MHRNAIETVMGAVVLAVAAFFLAFAYSSADIAAIKGYDVFAKFARVDGIRPGSDVRLSGIKVGTVVSETLEPGTYFAVVKFSVDNNVQLPKDTDAKIVSDGLLGNKYIALEPGADEKMLAPGGEITRTQSPINLEDLVSRYIFGGGSKKDGKDSKDSKDSGKDSGGGLK